MQLVWGVCLRRPDANSDLDIPFACCCCPPFRQTQSSAEANGVGIVTEAHVGPCLGKKHLQGAITNGFVWWRDIPEGLNVSQQVERARIGTWNLLNLNCKEDQRGICSTPEHVV